MKALQHQPLPDVPAHQLAAAVSRLVQVRGSHSAMQSHMGHMG